MIITIKNKELKVDIDLRGAQIISLIHNNKEYMWQTKEGYWQKHAPLLFPTIGTLPDNCGIYGNKKYEMGVHGFLQECEFKIKKQDEDKVELEYCFQEKDKKHYPYPFIFNVYYSVENKSLKEHFKIKNIGEKNMPYAFGLHPGFALEDLGCKVNDCSIDLNTMEKVHRVVIEENRTYTMEKKECLNTQNGVLGWKTNNVLPHPIIMCDLNSNHVAVLDKESKTIFEFRFKGFKYFALWCQEGAGFLCLEPWSAHTAFTKEPCLIEKNDSMNILKPNEINEYSAEVVMV